MPARAGFSPKRTRYGSLLVVATLGSLLEFFGFHWDIAWHVALGRDTFWSPPHLAVYLGVGILLAASAQPILPGRGRAPLGVYALAVSASCVVISAPIDDLWHRLYGIDTTIWSPPHLLLILSSSGVPLALALLLREGRADVPRKWWLPNPTLLLLGYLLAWLDVPLIEFRLHIPPPFWRWDFALFPPLMIGAALLAGLAGAAARRRPGAVTWVCLTFTAFALAINAETAAFGFRRLSTVPLLLPGAPVADLLLARPRRVPFAARAILASLAFGVLFYAVQYPYTALFARPAWTPRVLADGWLLASLLAPTAAGLGLALGRWLRPAPTAGPPFAPHRGRRSVGAGGRTPAGRPGLTAPAPGERRRPRRPRRRSQGPAEPPAARHVRVADPIARAPVRPYNGRWPGSQAVRVSSLLWDADGPREGRKSRSTA